MSARRTELFDEPEDDPTVTPYRAPRHQLALIAKNGAATIGIAHAGSILGAVNLPPADLVAFIGHLAEAAVALGVDRAELRKCVRATAGEAPARVPRHRAVPVPRERIGTCGECGQTFTPANTRGLIPLYCPACAPVVRERERREQRQRAAAEKLEARTGECEDCGAAFVRNHSLQTRCASCRDRHERQYQSDYRRRYRAGQGRAGDAARALSDRTGTCVACGTTFTARNKTGPVPKRCPACCGFEPVTAPLAVALAGGGGGS